MIAPGSRGFVFLLGGMGALTALSTDMSVPALPRLAEVFQTSADRAQLTLSLFLLGFAAGQLAYGPVSDRFGRRPVLLFGLTLYTLASIGCIFAGSIEQLIVFRLLQGLGGCAPRVMSPAIVRDEFHAERGAQVLSSVVIVMAIAPLVAPTIGGFLVQYFDWRAIFIVLTVAAILVLGAVATQFGESAKYRDASATRIAGILRNYGRFLGNRACLGYTLINCGVFGGMFCYISGSSFVLIDFFGLSTQLYGLFFSLNGLAFMAGSSINRRLLSRHAPQSILRVGLAICMLAGVLILLDAERRIGGPAGIIAPFILYCFGMALVYSNATARAMEPMPRIAGLASSLIGSSQMLSAALAGYLVNFFYTGTPVAMAAGVAVAAAIACLCNVLIVPRTLRR
ncbi:MAG: Bcr/CflA family drug resistance efflux transporter [Rhodospirillales bacterium]|nr:Bcr/CflA family drug resistance efflux transporter [Rhodospirillales bacterium]